MTVFTPVLNVGTFIDRGVKNDRTFFVPSMSEVTDALNRYQ
jgi:hypothetical protein